MFCMRGFTVDLNLTRLSLGQQSEDRVDTLVSNVSCRCQSAGVTEKSVSRSIPAHLEVIFHSAVLLLFKYVNAQWDHWCLVSHWEGLLSGVSVNSICEKLLELCFDRFKLFKISHRNCAFCSWCTYILHLPLLGYCVYSAHLLHILCIVHKLKNFQSQHNSVKIRSTSINIIVGEKLHVLSEGKQNKTKKGPPKWCMTEAFAPRDTGRLIGLDAHWWELNKWMIWKAWSLLYQIQME